MRTTIINLAGKQIGRWNVKSLADKSPTKWYCVCECGTERIVSSKALNAKIRPSRSCGCWGRELAREQAWRNRKHGMYASPTYRIWSTMKGRCNNLKNPKFRIYGGRGITCCERWLKFENFLADMGEKPAGLTLERIRNMEGYSPENCKWDTPKAQGRNRRNNRLVTLHGETHCLSEWAEKCKLNLQTIYSRLRYGWTLQEALAA